MCAISSIDMCMSFSAQTVLRVVELQDCPCSYVCTTCMFTPYLHNYHMSCDAHYVCYAFRLAVLCPYSI